ncbi:MAG: hypothetical protein Q9195_006278 [Heterodermia aff. obscurata]
MSAQASHPDCPFCAIAGECPPSTPAALLPPTALSQSCNPPSRPSARLAYMLLSTPYLIAFLDHAPISRGHVLVATRRHRDKLSDVSVQEGMALGKWLSIVSRAVMMGATGRESDEAEHTELGDWNVVQNNGARAAQVVPHVHFHIIPRIGDVPEVKARSWTVFGKGQREDLDEADAEILIVNMRTALGKEVERVRRNEGEEAVRLLLNDDAGTQRERSNL